MNKLLQRQLQNFFGTLDNVPENFVALFDMIGESYDHFEKDRKLLERSMDLSSKEMIELNSQLNKEKDELKTVHFELNTLFNNIEEAFFSIRFSDFKLVQMSAACEKIYGYKAKDFIANPNLWYSIIIEEDKKIIDSNYSVMQTGTAFAQEYRIWHKNGSIRWVESKITPTIDTDGNLMRIDGVTSDITKRKRAEEKIQRNEKRFRAMIEQGEDAIAIVSKNGDTIYLSPTNEKILGYTNEEITAQKILDKKHPDDDERLKAIFENLISTPGKVIHEQWRTLHKNGQWIWLDITLTNLIHEPEIKGIVINYRNITSIKNAEQQKVFDENNLKSLINNTNDLMWSVDQNLKLITSNKAFDDLIKLMSGGYIKKGEDVLSNTGFNPEQLKRWESFYKQALSGESFAEIEHTVSPVEFWSEISFYPIRQHDTVVGVACYSRNITELKKAQMLEIAHQELIKEKEFAENSKKLKDRFLANMSHEIRTPMNAIIGMTELLTENNINEEQKECIDVIKLSADSLLSIINDILDFSKIESGKIIFEKDPFELEKLIEGIVQTLHFTINKKSISLNYSIAPNVPAIIIGDVVKLRQILLNLCGNAVKFTQQGRIGIDVELSEQNDDNYSILFTVSDTGIGIPEDKLQVIFESFMQATGDTTRRYGGTGLGLTITKQLIELQGGSISVKSKQNEGSQFSFMLTFKKAMENELIPDETDKPYVYRGLEGIKVLLAEDNPMNKILAKKILSKWNLEYDIAENGKIAIEKLAQTYYDIILMDMHMPEMDGYEAAKYIRKEMQPPQSLTPIIAVTANAIVGEEEKCLAAGMDDYISKPLNKKKLYQKMLKLLIKKP